MHEGGNIVVVKLKVGMLEQVLDVTQVTGNQVIHGNNMKTFINKPVAQVRAEKSGSTGNQNALLLTHNLELVTANVHVLGYSPSKRTGWSCLLLWVHVYLVITRAL